MIVRTLLLSTAAAVIIAATPARAIPAPAGVTLTTSLATFLANTRNATSTVNTGLSDPLALNLPTTQVLPLADGQTLLLSNAAQVGQSPDGSGGYPYSLSDGFAGDLLIPVDGSANNVKTETLTPGSGTLSAFGFEVVPYSSSQNGPYTITLTVVTSTGPATLTQTAGNANLAAFPVVATPVFFGFYGGSVQSLTVATTDPQGLAFGNFIDVPEPASMAALLTGLLGLTCLRRRQN